jgi:hypothetical protein
MKHLLLADSEEVGTTVSVDLEAKGPGEYQVLPTWDYGITSVAPVTKPVTLTRRMETSKRGVVRILRKVEIPYSALFPSDPATGSSNLKFSANRSKGMVSCHVVLTLPKECVEDFKAQVAGSVGRSLAARQIATVMALCYSGTPVTEFPFARSMDTTALGDAIYAGNGDPLGWKTVMAREGEITGGLDRALAGFEWDESVAFSNLEHAD